MKGLDPSPVRSPPNRRSSSSGVLASTTNTWRFLGFVWTSIPALSASMKDLAPAARTVFPALISSPVDSLTPAILFSCHGKGSPGIPRGETGSMSRDSTSLLNRNSTPSCLQRL